MKKLTGLFFIIFSLFANSALASLKTLDFSNFKTGSPTKKLVEFKEFSGIINPDLALKGEFKAVAKKGIISKVLKIKTPKRPFNSAFEVRLKQNQYELYIYSELEKKHIKRGSLGLDGNSEELYQGRDLFQLAPDQEVFIIFISSKKRDELFSPNFYFGDHDQMQRTFQFQFSVDAIVAGAILLFFLYHLILFFIRREDKPSLFFSLLCFVMLMRIYYHSLIFNGIFPKSGSTLLIAITAKLEFAALMVSPLSILLMARYLFFSGKLTKLDWFFLKLGGFLLLAEFILPLDIMYNYLIIWQLFLLLSMPYVVYVFWLIIKGKDRSKAFKAKIMMGTGLILAFAGVNDVLFFMGYPSFPQVTSYATFLFFFSQSSVLALDFAETYKKNHLLLGQINQAEERLDHLKNENIELEKEMKTAGRQLVQAEKMSSLGQMVSGIAHDINNPLGYIASNRENLQKKSHEIRDFLFKLMGDAPEAKTTKDHLNSEFKSLDDGFTSIGRGSKILKGISSALRNYGRTDLDNKEACDLKEILENVATILNSKLKHLEFKSDFEGERIIKCRPSNLSQIFLNLISNACDALAEEEVENPTILFSSKRLNSGQEEILIKVEDNGPGIPDNIKNKILDAFFTTKAVGKGTGLGLSITNKIIQEHNGKITVKDSESLGGACFEIHLPIK